MLGCMHMPRHMTASTVSGISAIYYVDPQPTTLLMSPASSILPVQFGPAQIGNHDRQPLSKPSMQQRKLSLLGVVCSPALTREAWLCVVCHKEKTRASTAHHHSAVV
jgi:hypothetical protein